MCGIADRLIDVVEPEVDSLYCEKSTKITGVSLPPMSRFPKADLSHVSLISIADRNSKVAEREWATPISADATMREFVDSLPDILIGRDLREFARLCAESVR